MHGNTTHVRDHLPPGNIQLIIVGKLQLVETNANHCTDLHVHGLLLWEPLHENDLQSYAEIYRA